MNGALGRKYRFGPFEFEADRHALYHHGELIKVERKALEVLDVLIREPHKLIPAQEIIDEVWRDNPHGITPMHLAQSISKLRKALAAYDPETKFIDTVKGGGYSFSADADLISETPDLAEIRQPAVDVYDHTSKTKPDRTRYRIAVAVVLVTVLVVIATAAWIAFPSNEEEEVRRVITESQRFESLVLYRDPESFKETDLDKYWTAETDDGSNFDRKNIRTGVRKLIEDERHYGPESKNEQFEFQSVEINSNRDMAVVKTLEKWFIAEYKKDGTLIRNKTVGPYFVSYILRKIDGRWLIEKSNTARANPPSPSLEGIETRSDPVSGKEFFINLKGSDFVVGSVFLKVIGPGCPEASPCTVPNSALRLRSELSDTQLTNVPLTLTSGEFLIQAQNGESAPSNSISLIIK